MAHTWTKEQRQVIDLRDCNMLVSAAAGSGKTAVLVERIISRIMDEEKPVDIDRLLVVTFTNAAAAEMRERIREALEKKLAQCPENVHLQKQITLIHHAKITTIHSFCLDVIRNHFDAIRLDPGFRIGDEGELKLMRQDVMEKLLEEEYAEADPGFLAFAEAFAPGKTDSELEELILQLYDFSMGYPWPDLWRDECLKDWQAETVEELYRTAWMGELLEKLKLQVSDMKNRILRALRIAGEPSGPWQYAQALEQDLSRLEKLENCESYGAYAREFGMAQPWPALSRKKDASVSERKKEQVKEIRDQVKKELKSLEEDYFFAEPEQMLEDMKAARGMVGTMLELTKKFQAAFEREKTEKNIVDFNDLEHYALKILVEEKDGEICITRTAREYADYFEEIMIDEYQDSNLVQEILLTSVFQKEKHNLFMVGDVKQSIYRFRLARPELFMEKYKTYTLEQGENRRIDLHKNFRSRSQVLEGVNLIFRQIMGASLGGIAYDDQAALYPGAVFAEGAREDFLQPEVLLAVRDGAAAQGGDHGAEYDGKDGMRKETRQEESDPEDEEKEEQDLRKQEAVMAARRIREIVGHEKVWDKELGAYRPARYADIVVLLRTVSGWADQFVQVFTDMGIPAYTGTGSGYFSAAEVKTVLAYLRVLDNPRQDIPLAAVLRSPIGKLTDEELAQLRICSPETDFYGCVIRYLDREAGERSEELFRKLEGFWDMTQRLRDIVSYTPMHLLLWEILDRTGYGDYAAAMPGGAQRSANLNMLVEKAIAYEATSYRGLFHFIRYIENLQKYEIDYGEASSFGEAEDTVRIMSIHKSKGLEFPVVFVCGLGKNFNQQEARSRLVLHPTLGIGCDYTDLEHRMRIPLLVKKVISRQTREENLGEELRVLYVAMTRAKEKLILTGAVKNLDNSMKKWSRELERQQEELSYSGRIAASSFLDWIMPALLRHESGADLAARYELEAPESFPLFHEPGGFRIDTVTGESQQEKNRQWQSKLLCRKEELLNLPIDQTYDPGLCSGLERIFSEQYPFRDNLEIPGKLSVSELKKMGGRQEMQDSVRLYEEPAVVPLLPRFRQETQECSGAARGTVYHRFLENLDFTGTLDRKFIESQLETMMNCGKILKDEAEWISLKKIEGFLKSEIARRMSRAAETGRLYREQPFVLGIGANRIRPDWDPEEEVLIQGIIDAFFFEGDEIILLDYKTDYVREGQEDLLVGKYRIQLEYYQLALERLTGKKVKEKIIYSFCLDRELPVGGQCS